MPEDTLINFEHRVSNLEGESLRDGKDANPFVSRSLLGII